jgi:hypothetical protein
MITFISFIVLALLLGTGSVLPGTGRGAGRALTALGLAGAVCVLEMAASTHVPALTGVFGIFERLDYLATTAGLAVLAALACGARRAAANRAAGPAQAGWV